MIPIEQAIEIDAQTEPVDVPLCVDLDGTLIRSDMLWEATVLLLRDKPLLAFALPIWLLKGRAALKRRIVQNVKVPVDSLPYNLELLEWLRAEKENGRALVLATAADQSVADLIAAHLHIFNTVLSSDGRLNLKGPAKLEALKARYGRGFDYVGNASVDLPIWKECRNAIVVDAPGPVVRKAQQIAHVSRIFDSRHPLLPLIVREIRLHQWLKNLLVLVPLITSHQFTNLNLLFKAGVAFLAFGLVASSVYVLNDVFDLQSDRAHHKKRKRPFASGDLPLPWAFLLAPGLLLAGFALVGVFIPSAIGVLATYYGLTVLYSYWLKGQLLLDVFALAALYTIRMAMGSAAYHVDLSVWLLSFSMFLFLSLGFAKRAAELQNMVRAGASQNSRRAYKPGDMNQINTFGVAAGCASSLVLTLYMNSNNVRVLYRRPNLLWFLFPLMLYWICRIWIITSRGEMDEDPVLFAAKDKTTIGVLVLCLLVMVMAMHDGLHLY